MLETESKVKQNQTIVVVDQYKIDKVFTKDKDE